MTVFQLLDLHLIRVERMLGLALTEVLREDPEDACAALAQVEP